MPKPREAIQGFDHMAEAFTGRHLHADTGDLLLYVPTYGIKTLHLPAYTGFVATLVGGIILATFSIVAGYWSDKIRPRARIMLITAWLFLLAAYPCFWLMDALEIIREIDRDSELKARVGQCSKAVNECFDTVARFLGTADYGLLATLRNNVAFHYTSKLPMRRLKRLVDIQPDHRFGYSMGNDTLDWYFELGDLIIDEVVIRDV